MPRSAWILIVVALFGVHIGWSVLVYKDWVSKRPVEVECFEYLADPHAAWLKIKGCELEIGRAVLESEAGDFEPLDNRGKGLSTHLYESPPKWVAVWLPLRAGVKGAGRAVLRNESADLLKWVNQLEAAPDDQKEQMWADPVVLRRMSRPGLIVGRAEKPDADVLRKAFGSTASVNLYLVRPGVPEETTHPSLMIGGGLFLAILVSWALSKSIKRVEVAQTAEQVTARQIVGQTQVQLGELEQLREEERQARRRKS